MNTPGPSAVDVAAFGLNTAWSRNINVLSHDGATHRWHILDRPGTDVAAHTILCLHGNPTWSFLWSRVLNELDHRYRVIAPDHLSMGFSERTSARSYRERVQDIADLLDALDVHEPVWIAAQDWGGAIAMGFAVSFPDRVAGLVLFNTGIAIPANRKAPILIKISAAFGLHRLITQYTSLFVRGTPFLPGMGITREQRQALANPYKRSSQRKAVAQFVADVPFNDRHPSHADIAHVAESVSKLEIPVRLVWGSKDPVFNDDFAEDLLSRFTDVSLHRIAGAGHLAVLETPVSPMIEAAMMPTPSPLTRMSPPVVETLWSRIGTSRDPSAIAVCDAASDDVITNAEFASLVATFAAALQKNGVQRGERVALLVPPSIDLIAVVYACWRIGAVTVIADRGLGLRGLGAAVKSARVSHVIGVPQALAAARVLRWAPHARFFTPRFLRRGQALPSLADVVAPIPLANDAAAVLFTSGATGPAKGVRYTHGQLCAQRDALQSTYNITVDDRFVAAFAPFALYGPALGICTGLADMDVTAPSTLTATALNDACDRINATMVFASPAALHNVVHTAHSDMAALSRVRLVMSAGAPVPIETLEKVSVLAPHAELHTPYGMTEALPVADISLTARHSVGIGRGVCVGHPVHDARILIASLQQDIQIEECLPGDTGEVLVLAPWVSSGYDRLWLTEQLARPVVLTSGEEHVWHRTGDVGHLDALGNLWIEGRVVHLIHTAAGAITPVPLEIAVESLSSVIRAAAVGVGPVGVQQVVIVAETNDITDGPASAGLAAEVRRMIFPQAVAAVYTTKHLPVDIRHNSKIDRTALGLSMARLLSGESK